MCHSMGVRNRLVSILSWNNIERGKNLKSFSLPVPKEQVWAALSLSRFTHNNCIKSTLCEPWPCVPLLLYMSNSSNNTRFSKAICISPMKTHMHHESLWWNPVVSHLMFPLSVLTSTMERTMCNFSLIISSNIICYVCFEFYHYVTSFLQTLCSSFSALLPFCPYL